jgi:hypothetical protein
MGVRQAAAMEALDSYGKPQLHRSAMEFHGHGGRTQLWNPRAGTNGQWRRVHPPLPGGQANPVRPQKLRFSHNSCMTALSPALACAWQSCSARLTIFSLGTKNAVRTGRWKFGRRMKNSIVRNWVDLLRVYVFSPDWTIFHENKPANGENICLLI